MELSLVIPLYNEEKGIDLLFKELNSFSNKFPKETEVILVDDGSQDETLKLLKINTLKFKKKIISFSRNFGHQAALLAGLEAATGKYVVTLDGDLQHPLALIPQMLQQHQQGYDIVLTTRIDTTSTNLFKRVSASFFYFIINALSDTSVPLNTSDFRSLNQAALQSLLKLPERRKFLRGLVNWIGYKKIVIPYEVGTRSTGTSKYSLFKMLKLAFHGITSSSTLPLYFAGWCSGLFFLAALFYAFYVLYIRFILGDAVSGWASVQFVLLALGGFLSLFLGLIGIYLAAIYEEIKQRPLFIVKEEKLK